MGEIIAFLVENRLWYIIGGLSVSSFMLYSPRSIAKKNGYYDKDPDIFLPKLNWATVVTIAVITVFWLPLVIVTAIFMVYAIKAVSPVYD